MSPVLSTSPPAETAMASTKARESRRRKVKTKRFCNQKLTSTATEKLTTFDHTGGSKVYTSKTYSRFRTRAMFSRRA